MKYVDAKTPSQRRELARKIFEEVRKEAEIETWEKHKPQETK